MKRNVTRYQKALRRFMRPWLERLESRVTPSNIDVLSYHYDLSLTGQNLQEQDLTYANVNSTNFGTLFSNPIDGQAYAQPLYKANLPIPGMGTRNVAFIATEHDSVYAFDADNPGAPIWHDIFIDPAHGITTIPYQELSTPDLFPEIGITGTPVIDGATNTLYVDVKTREVRSGVVHYVQKLHALDLATGADKPNSPYQLGDSVQGGPDGGWTDITDIYVNGTGGGSSGGRVNFNAARENERMSMQLVGNIVYLAFASHADFRPYHGWVIGFDKTTLQPIKVFNTAPNADGVAIWQSGGGLSFDDQGYMYFAVGNGFGANAFDPAHGNYSESVLKIDTTPNWTPNDPQMMTVADYFTPFNWQQLDGQDADLGSGGVLLLPDSVGSSAHPHLMIETGKQGRIYLIDRDNMGQFTPNGPDHVVQTVTAGQTGVWGNPAFFQMSPASGIIYYHGSGDVLKGYIISNGHIDDISSHILRSTFPSNFPGEQPTISADGTGNPSNPVNGIVWELRVDNAAGRIQGQGDNTMSGPATLRAFNASDFSAVLYDSSAVGVRDFFGGSVKFTAPIVTNGHLIIGTADHFSVMGLFPVATSLPDAPSDLAAVEQAGTNGPQVQLTWTNNATNATGVRIFRSTDGVNFSPLSIANRNSTTFTDTNSLMVGNRYYYRLAATNQMGDSAFSNVDSVIIPIASSVLTATGTGSSFINLAWTSVANDHYDIERSTDGVNFNRVATVPAFRTTYTDTALSTGQYTYRIHAFSAAGDSFSNVAGTWVGATIDHGTPDTGGFVTTTDLTANGSTAFMTNLVRLTEAVNQTGSLFSNTRMAVGQFTTHFEVRLHEGTQPDYADGFTFVIQANAPSALGQAGAGLGYQGIGRSIAIKFSTFQHTGDPSASSVNLVLNGANPAGGFDTTPSGVLLNSQNIKAIDISYDGSVLTLQIEDVLTQAVYTRVFTVNIPQVIGSDTAYVGFTGATGSGNFFELEDVLSWVFTSQAAVPGAPANLRVTQSASAELDLAWDANSYNESGFQLERSADGVRFTTIATTTATSYADVDLPNGSYFYRVRAFNDAGSSRPSSNLAASLPTPLLLSHQDIGNPGVAGSATFANGTYTLRASGSDIWGNADQMQYLYRPFTGDGTIVARLVSLQSGVNDFAKAGVMFRDSLAAGAENAFMMQFPNPGQRPGWPTYQWRASTNGGTADHELQTAHPMPLWLRMDRAGSLFSGYWAFDVNGMPGTWNPLGAEMVPMGQTVFVGLALTSHDNTRLVTASFDNVEIIPAVLQVSHLDVTVSPDVSVAGNPVTITVAALDAYNNPVPGYLGTVHFTSSDPAFLPPPDYTFTSDDNGVHVFSGIPFFTAGFQTITLTDTATNEIVGTGGITVLPAAASSFQVLAPSTVASGAPFDITLIAVDPYGNTDTNYTGTVHFTTSDGANGVMLPADYPFQPSDGGVVTFTAGGQLITLGDQTITATDIVSGITGTATISVTGGDAPGPRFGPEFTHGGATALTLTAEHGQQLRIAPLDMPNRNGPFRSEVDGTVPSGRIVVEPGHPWSHRLLPDDLGIDAPRIDWEVLI